jgi:hypothetical protein
LLGTDAVDVVDVVVKATVARTVGQFRNSGTAIATTARQSEIG